MFKLTGKLSDLKAHQQSWELFIQAKKKMVGLCEKPIKIKAVTEENFSDDSLRLEVVPVNDTAIFYQRAKQLLHLADQDIDEQGGYFFLPWETTATATQLTDLAQTASVCFFSYEPAPFIEGELNRALRSADEVDALVSSILHRANLPRKWQVVDSKLKSVDSTPQVEFAIRLLQAPQNGLVQGAQSGAAAYTRAQSVVSMSKALLPQGFELFRVEALLENSNDLSQILLIGAKTYAEVLHKSRQVGAEFGVSVRIRGIIYRFRTVTNAKETAAIQLENFAAVAADDGQLNWLLNFASQLTTQFPGIEIEVQPTSRRLKFRYFLQHNNRAAENLKLQNFLDSCRPAIDEQQLVLQLADNHKLRFIARYEPKRRLLTEADRLRKLIKEEIGIGEGKARLVLGALSKVKYPFLTVSLAPNFGEDNRAIALERLIVGEIKPNLTGDREKLDRLTKALNRIADPEAELPNPQTRWVLFDAAAAAGAAVPADLAPDSATWQDVVRHSFLPLNHSQTEAVVATLLSPDLALVQGPPGTGKSTAISQIIWHLVRQNQGRRILLTSETNTAVDNALEKLENQHHNLVKPVRISPAARIVPTVPADEAAAPNPGRAEAGSGLEREGARYALPRLTAWAETPHAELTDEVQDNIVRRWLLNIACRAARNTPADLPTELQAAWAAVLDAPSKSLKTNFLDQYLRHANVIGATGGALGELSTTGRPTNFFKQYQAIFKNRPTATDQARAEKEAADAKAAGKQSPVRQPLKNPLKSEQARSAICFDVVVMDEASKATPPELALAMIYAHRAVVIGDHRQLPPMLDEGDFRETLEAEGETALAAQFSRADAETSQFERLFTRPGVQPGTVSRFDTQYRMHPDINAVVQQFYADDGGLNCGIPADKADDLDIRQPLSRFHGLRHPVLVQPDDHLVWVEVDEPEMLVGTSRVNLAEVQAVRAVLACLARSEGFAEFQQHWTKPEDQEVALITFYGEQVRLLNAVAAQVAAAVPTRVETVDKFQGMERNVVVVSLVRSDKITESRTQRPDLVAFPASGGYPPQPSLGFAESPNRLNVALSRAKRLLIIVGNSRHFSRHDCYRRVFETVQARGRVVDYRDLLPFLTA